MSLLKPKSWRWAGLSRLSIKIKIKRLGRKWDFWPGLSLGSEGSGISKLGLDFQLALVFLSLASSASENLSALCTLCSFKSSTPKYMFEFTSPRKLRSVKPKHELRYTRGRVGEVLPLFSRTSSKVPNIGTLISPTPVLFVLNPRFDALPPPSLGNVPKIANFSLRWKP